MTVDRDKDGLTYPYACEICGVSGKDVSCAWFIVAIVFLGLIVLSLV
jgi:hypothetical protein